MFIRQVNFGLIRSGLGAVILVVAICFQLLPSFLLLVVAAHALGVSGGILLAIIPALFFVMVFALCWLASKRARHVPARPPSRVRRAANRSARGPVVLLKTHAERYQDLRDILGRAWR